jgi:ABC-type multidrug transport system fused ATPase/permease subunit
MKREHETYKLLHYLVGYLKGSRVRYLLGLFLFSGHKLLQSIISGQLYRTVSSLSTEDPLSQVYRNIGSLLAVLVCVAGLMFIGETLLLNSSVQADRNLRIRLSRKISRMPLGIWSKEHSGYWMNLINKDADTVLDGHQTKLVSFLTMIFSSAAGLIIVAIQEWRMAAFALLAGIFYFFLGYRFRGRARSTQSEMQKESANAASALRDLLSGYLVVRFYQMEEYFRKHHINIIRRMNEAGKQYAKLASTVYAMQLFGYSLSYAGALIFGLSLVNFKSLSLPDMMFLWPICAGASYGIQSLGFQITEFQITAVATERVESALSLPEEQGGQKDTPIPNNQALVFEDVSFSYQPGIPVLRNITFSIEEGEKVAIVGLSGSGKSTLARLALRLYEPDTGHIAVFGVSAEEYQLSVLRDQFSYLQQNPHLFQDTLGKNIAIAKNGVGEGRIADAAEKAHVHDFISRLPQRYDTYVGEGKGDLSGGERQRIGLARCYLRDAPIFIMDEMTSALDAGLEEITARELFSIKEKTLLYITHRLAAAQYADRIIVLEDGKIAEAGTHPSLLLKGGIYAAMWAMQSG